MENINPGLALYAPQWYRRLTTQSIDELESTEEFNNNGGHLAINNNAHCIVGEVHDFMDIYINCRECYYTFSGGLYCVIANRNETHLKYLIDHFVDHCEKKHPKEVPLLIAAI